MSRAVIVGGAPIDNYPFVKQFLRADDFMVYCDSGLLSQPFLETKIDLIVGDFDSHQWIESDSETIVLPVEKDDTDSVYALKEVIKRGFDEFLFLGVIGKRFDHSLGNLGMLAYLKKYGLKGTIVDDYSVMYLVNGETQVPTDVSYFSLLALSETVRNVQIKRAKYELNGVDIRLDYQFGVSNEVLNGQTPLVSCESGLLLLVCVYE